MNFDFEKIYDELFAFCRKENFSGYDPFDGLNSPFFRASPLKFFAPARLVWLQTVKRSAKNLRPALKIEKGVNPKGIALFALAELARFRAAKDARYAANARELLNRLLDLQIKNPKIKDQKPKAQDPIPKTSFGYNFDWQSRAFFAPAGTPTIVPTAFAAQAFIEAYRAFGERGFIETADNICRFILEDLNRSFESEDEICFSYTPLDRSVIFNASLLAGETLAATGAVLENELYLDIAARTARFVTRRQKENGAWAYGSKLRHAWVDNFHTAYILLSLRRISELVPAVKDETAGSIKNGLNFWLENFFLDDGAPKYYDAGVYPIDIHSAAAAVAALCELDAADRRCLPQAEKTLVWTIENMRAPEGYFYYQKLKDKRIETPFIRWGQAWMAYALARFIEVRKQVN